jgi:hypothetical protein
VCAVGIVDNGQNLARAACAHKAREAVDDLHEADWVRLLYMKESHHYARFSDSDIAWQMTRHNLIQEFFSEPEDAIKFFVQLKVLRFATSDGGCVATLTKETDAKWIYVLEWKDGKVVCEHFKPFKPSKENIEKFNNGCAGLADLFDQY